MGGERVFRLRPGEVNKNVIFEALTRHETETVMIQRYIPAIEQGDKRVIIINGEVVPYSLARIPLAGETRGNLAAGGRGVAQPLTEKDREIAETLRSEERRVGKECGCRGWGEHGETKMRA